MDKPTIYRKPMGESLFEEEFTVNLSQMGSLEDFLLWWTLRCSARSLKTFC